MNQEELLHKIDLFLWKLLPAAEQKAFEAEIQQNPSLQEMVAQRQLENEVIKQMQRNDLNAKVTGWLDEIDFDKVTPVDLDEEEKQLDTASPQPHPLSIKTDDSRKLPLRFWVLGIAASIALLLMAGNWWIKTNYKIDNVSKNQMVESGNLEINPLKKFGGSNPNLPTIDSVRTYYDLRQYDKAITAYQGFLKDAELIAINEQAKQKAEWQLVATYMAQNNPNYRALLDEIATNPKHLYHQKALELKEKTNSIWWKLAN
jgi:hypothetical protein